MVKTKIINDKKEYINQLKEKDFFSFYESNIVYLYLRARDHYIQTSNNNYYKSIEIDLLNLSNLEIEQINTQSPLWSQKIKKLVLKNNEIEFISEE